MPFNSQIAELDRCFILPMPEKQKVLSDLTSQLSSKVTPQLFNLADSSIFRSFADLCQNSRSTLKIIPYALRLLEAILYISIQFLDITEPCPYTEAAGKMKLLDRLECLVQQNGLPNASIQLFAAFSYSYLQKKRQVSPDILHVLYSTFTPLIENFKKKPDMLLLQKATFALRCLVERLPLSDFFIFS
jgi:hypothetical protein